MKLMNFLWPGVGFAAAVVINIYDAKMVETYISNSRTQIGGNFLETG